MIASFVLAQREILRFYRQKGRVIGALVTPMLFWALLGSGFGGGYLGDFFPGALLLMIVFTAVFATIGIVDDRRDGFLGAALATPAPRWAIVAGVTLGITAIATAQAALLLPLARWVGYPLGIREWLLATLVCAVISAGCGAAGLAVAWRAESAQGYHGFMNAVVVPLWLLSGAIFPSGSPLWTKLVQVVNPLAYGLTALRSTLDPVGAPVTGPLSLALPMTLVLAVAGGWWAVRTVSRN